MGAIEKLRGGILRPLRCASRVTRRCAGVSTVVLPMIRSQSKPMMELRGFTDAVLEPALKSRSRRNGT